METDRIQLASLVPHPRNAEHRTIDDDARKALVASIVRGSAHHPDNGDGYRLDTTITVNRRGNRILGGHRRVEALESLGQDWIHPDDITWVEYEPDSDEELACVLKLNNPKLSGEWIVDGLANLLQPLALDESLFRDLRFDDLAIDLDLPPLANSQDVELKQLDTKPPPKMTWALIGIPTVRFGEIAERIESLAAISGIVLETTVNDG